jgi:hypothetical protein
MGVLFVRVAMSGFCATDVFENHVIHREDVGRSAKMCGGADHIREFCLICSSFKDLHIRIRKIL